MPSLQIGQPLFHTTLANNPLQNKIILERMYDDASPAGKFHLDIGQRFTYNRFAPRTGEWSTPFPTIIPPQHVMPVYDPTFSKTFTEVTDQRAVEVKQLLNNNPDMKLALYYSGGIDSMITLISLLKVLNYAELARLTICMSMHSIAEYPTFFEKYIQGKFNIIDLTLGKVRYDNLFDMGYTIITADSGDAMFGTEVSTQFYYSYKNFCKNLSSDAVKKYGDLLNNVASAEVHYSTYADLLIAYFGYDKSPGFGQMYYEKLVKLSNTSQYQVHSLHDFFWQIIFNIKWCHCALRGPLFFGESQNLREPLDSQIINWYNTDDYQRWSMVNNNTGQKIRGVTSATYKWAGREYIYNFTKDSWYKHFKLKLASLPKIGPQEKVGRALDVGLRFALDTDYEVIRFNDPGVKEYIRHYLSTCQIDW